MKASSLYASALTAESITEPTEATVDAVDVREYQGRKKITLTFEDLPGALILNKTNAMEVIKALGDDTDTWTGATMTITVEKVDFKGKKVHGLRLSKIERAF